MRQFEKWLAEVGSPKSRVERLELRGDTAVASAGAAAPTAEPGFSVLADDARDVALAAPVEVATALSRRAAREPYSFADLT